ncbi:MAG: amidohydrolase [Acidobacteria bacterium]|nr:amidohydrolase [Acidobacteriota bacterium]
MMKEQRMLIGLIALMLALASGCGTSSNGGSTSDVSAAAAIYFGGDIITMEGDSPAYAEALAVKDGKIVFVGNKADAEKMKGSGTKMNDLQGKTLLPGFIDAHGHVWNAGFQKLAGTILPPPDGKGSSIQSIIEVMNEWKSKNEAGIKKLGWIIGMGYDEGQLSDARRPTAADADKISTTLPVILLHQSGHIAVANHKALELAGYNAATPDPKGGAIIREKDGKTPNGVLEEMAAFNVLFPILAKIDPSANETIALAGVEAYKGFGFTTGQEGRANDAAAETWKKLAAEKRLEIDIDCYPDIQGFGDYLRKETVSKEYKNHYRVAGAKLSMDGSPQGKTAWLTKPYLVPPAGQPKTYVGYPAIADNKQVQSFFDEAYANNWQILAHCSGDAASEQMISSIQKAEAKYGKADRRPVMIHAHTVRADQLDKMKSLGVIPSFFSMHTYYWGDWHRDSVFGKERAYFMEAANTAFRKGMIFTEHHDAPVGLPSSIMVIATAVNRTSRSNQIIGEDERITPYMALESITKWAAYQGFQENSKGTLKAGKLADLVVLDKNPLKVEPKQLFDVRVLETIKEGKSIYKK